MTQQKIFEAYQSLYKLSKQELPIREAWNIAKQLDQLRPFWQFQRDEECKFLETHEHNLIDGGILFKCAEDKEAFEKRVDDIFALDQDVEIKPFKLALSDDIKLTAQDVKTLQGDFVEFVEG